MSVINKLAIFGFILFVALGVTAQSQFQTHVDIGDNNVSEGRYIKSSFFGSGTIYKTKITAGALFDIQSPNQNTITGSLVKATRNVSLKERPFNMETYYMYNRFSQYVHESNFGVLAHVEKNYLSWKLGTSFRTYKPSPQAIRNGVEDNRIHEFWSLMYLLRYNIKPKENLWNAGITVTNIDYFIINQPTNPIFYIHGKYKVNEPLTLYAEAWYKSAGSLNISVNPFGYFLRTGLIWEIGK